MAAFRNVVGASVLSLAALGLAACQPPQGSSQASASAASSSPAGSSPAASGLTPAVAQMVETEAPVRPDGGTFDVPAEVDGAVTLNFTIDSGASDVTIPKDIVDRLIETGAITKDDYIGDQTFVLADGSTLPSSEFRIKSLKVGDLVLHDVTASLTGDDGSLLLGESFLSRLSSWSIDNGRRVLTLKADPAQLQQASASAATPNAVAPTAAQDAPEPMSDQGADGPVMNEDVATNLAQQYLAAWSNPQDPTGAGVRRFYAGAVNFYGSSLGLDALMAQKLKFAQAWPTRSYTPRQGTMTADCTDKFTCTVRAVVDWRTASGDGRSATGSSSIAMEFHAGLIDKESGGVIAEP